jgi:hypothetical protein
MVIPLERTFMSFSAIKRTPLWPGRGFGMAVLVFGILVALPAYCALGGDAASIQADQICMQGSLRTSAAEAYTVQEIRGANGAAVREYVSPSGKVFGVAWQGPWPPDLHQLLGSYFDQYLNAVQTQSKSRVGRRPIAVSLPGLVVEIGGHPRAFAGRAYAPDLAPAGVTVETIQ